MTASTQPGSFAVRLPTRDPFSDDPLIATRLENPSTGTSFEGRFPLGWIGRLTPEQLDFVGLLLARRNNLQKLAADLGIAYNTARSRFEDIVGTLGGLPGEEPVSRGELERNRLRETLERIAAGELSSDDAERLLDS